MRKQNQEAGSGSKVTSSPAPAVSGAQGREPAEARALGSMGAGGAAPTLVQGCKCFPAASQVRVPALLGPAGSEHAEGHGEAPALGRGQVRVTAGEKWGCWKQVGDRPHQQCLSLQAL